jgi:hypothetical protein
MARKAKLLPGQQKLSNFFSKPAGSVTSGSSAVSPVRAAASTQCSSTAASSPYIIAAAGASSPASSASNVADGVGHDGNSSGFSGFRMASTLSRSGPRAASVEATASATATPGAAAHSAHNNSSNNSSTAQAAQRSPARRPGTIALRTDVVGLQFRTEAAAPEAIQKAPLVLQRESWNRVDSNAIQGMCMLTVSFAIQQATLPASQPWCALMSMLSAAEAAALGHPQSINHTCVHLLVCMFSLWILQCCTEQRTVQQPAALCLATCLQEWLLTWLLLSMMAWL